MVLDTGRGQQRALDDLVATAHQIGTAVESVIDGKAEAVRLALIVLLAEGHLLIEDVPGVGKTMLAKALARSIDCSVRRVQFTPDLLPSDITGVNAYNQERREFEFKPGPVFANIVVGDEINRASPKTQSALLEAMEEGRVTVDGETHRLGEPFMIIATQNPIEQAGTYRLPEAQLDRFLMKTSLGYPDHDSTVALLADAATRDRSAALEPVITANGVKQMAKLADEVHVDPSVLSYVSQIAHESRQLRQVKLGLSVRGCLAFVRTAKTWAAADGRAYVVPDDIKELAVPILCHRLLLDAEAEFSGVLVEDVISQLLTQVRPPTERAA